MGLTMTVTVPKDLLRRISKELLSAYAAQMGHTRYKHAAFLQPKPDRLEGVLREIDAVLKKG
jgi:hypothetical protein